MGLTLVCLKYPVKQRGDLDKCLEHFGVKELIILKAFSLSSPLPLRKPVIGDLFNFKKAWDILLLQ